MNLNYLYILLPIIFWPLVTILLTKFSREKWSIQTVLYRQVAILLFWAPILFFINESDLEILKSNLDSVFLASLFWSIYISLTFFWFHYLPVWISRVFSITSRVILSLFLWVFILWENIFFIDIVWFFIMFIWLIYLSFQKVDNLHLKKKNILLWVLISTLNGVLFWLSIYYFKIYSVWMNPIVSAYILESTDIILLTIFALLFSFHKKINYFKIWKNDFLKIILISPVALLWSIWLAISYDYINFYVINSLFVMIFFVSLFLGYIFLWEKITKKQFISMFIIMIWLFLIVSF